MHRPDIAVTETRALVGRYSLSLASFVTKLGSENKKIPPRLCVDACCQEIRQQRPQQRSGKHICLVVDYRPLFHSGTDVRIAGLKGSCMAAASYDDKKKISADCWRKGSEAVSRENWDYAIDMFFQAVVFVPDNLMYRQTLRGTEYKKYNNNKTGAKMASMKLVGIRGKVKKAKLKKDWEAVSRAAEEGLKVNPWDAGLNADLGEACRNLGFGEVAIFSYQNALKEDSNNKDYNRLLAELYEGRGEYAAAAKLWSNLMKLDPLDSHARMKYNQVQANSVLDRGGYENAKSTRDTLSDQEIAQRLKRTEKDKQADGPGVSVEADLQRAIRKEPENPDLHVKLAQYYQSEGKLAEAAQAFSQALDLSGGDTGIREQCEDAELNLMRKNLEVAKSAADSGDDASRKQTAELANGLLKREIEVFSSRVERYPANLRLKYELAKRFMRVSKFSQAIPLLQQSVKDARMGGEVLVSLAECFLADKKPPLARRQLEKAVPLLDSQDHADLFKKAHYYLGRICEDSGEPDKAEEHYSEVLAIDYEYKDTLKRLEGLQGGDAS